jgi:Amt family ammonium transporter
VLAVGIFADGTYGAGWNGISGNVKGALYGDGGQLAAQAAHVVVGFAWAVGITYLIFTIAKRFMKIRVSAEAELAGLDEPEFGALCYPDFVLTTVSSGHPDTSASAGSNGGNDRPAYAGHEPSPSSDDRS